MDITDPDYISAIKSFDNERIAVGYEKHKPYCLNYIRKLSFDGKDGLGIYHYAFIALVKNVRGDQYEQREASIQTYLNSICIYRCRTITKAMGNTILIDMSAWDYDESITDQTAEDLTINQGRLRAIVEELKKLKNRKRKWYDILDLFYYKNKSMEEIALALGYKNANSVKNQKARCLRKLKDEIDIRLHPIQLPECYYSLKVVVHDNRIDYSTDVSDKWLDHTSTVKDPCFSKEIFEAYKVLERKKLKKSLNKESI